MPWQLTEEGRKHAAFLEAMQRKHVLWQERESPYRAEPDCQHDEIIETTCEAVSPTWLDEFGAVHCWPMVRGRHFECASCHTGVWPAADGIRINAPRRSVCTSPACDCFDDAPPRLQEIVRELGVAPLILPVEHYS